MLEEIKDLLAQWFVELYKTCLARQNFIVDVYRDFIVLTERRRVKRSNTTFNSSIRANLSHEGYHVLIRTDKDITSIIINEKVIKVNEDGDNKYYDRVALDSAGLHHL